MLKKVDLTPLPIEIRLTRLQAAEENKQKLAALKKWHHVDGFDKESFEGLRDDILYDMLWEDWDRVAVTDSAVKGEIGNNTTSSTKIDERRSKRARPVEEDSDNLSEGLFPWDEDDVLAVSSKPASDSEAYSVPKAKRDESGFSSDDEPIIVPRKRKSTRTSTSTSADKSAKAKSRSTSIFTADAGRKHNLNDLGETGQGGRVMFVFEKVSASKMK